MRPSDKDDDKGPSPVPSSMKSLTKKSFAKGTVRFQDDDGSVHAGTHAASVLTQRSSRKGRMQADQLYSGGAWSLEQVSAKF